jgi:hypothetical protein
MSHPYIVLYSLEWIYHFLFVKYKPLVTRENYMHEVLIGNFQHDVSWNKKKPAAYCENYEPWSKFDDDDDVLIPY